MEKYEQINLIGELQDSLTEEEQLFLEADSIFKQIEDSPLLSYKADFMKHSFLGYVDFSMTLFYDDSNLFTEHERDVLSRLREIEAVYENKVIDYQEDFFKDKPEEGDRTALLNELLSTEEYQELLNNTNKLNSHMSKILAVAWVRYVDSLQGNYDQAMADIKAIYNCSIGKSRHYKNHQYKAILFTLDREDIHAEVDIPLFGTDREKILTTCDNLYSYWLQNYAIFPLIAISYYDYDDTEALELVSHAKDEVRKLLETADLSSEPIEPTAIQRTIVPVTSIEYPLDPVNNKIWGNANLILGEFVGVNTTARIDRAIDKELQKQINILLEQDKNITIDGAPLSDYEKRVMISADNLFTAGNPVITASAIYKNMTGKVSPNANQVQEVNDAITRLSNTNITIDLTSDYDSYVGTDEEGQKKYVYEGKLVPIEKISAYIDGKFTDSAIHLFDEPPLMKFARDRGQLTTLRLEDYQLKNLSQTHLKVRDYLIKRIAPMKNAEANKSKKGTKKRPLSRTIKLDSLFKATGCDTSMKRKRGLEKTEEHLEELKSTGYIKGYTYTKNGNGITIIL